MPETDEAMVDRIKQMYPATDHEAGERADLATFTDLEYEVMQWSKNPAHVNDCDCDLPMVTNPACWDATQWRWAVVIDDAAHGPRFVCWADQSAADSVKEWEAGLSDNAHSEGSANA